MSIWPVRAASKRRVARARAAGGRVLGSGFDGTEELDAEGCAEGVEAVVVEGSGWAEGAGIVGGAGVGVDVADGAGSEGFEGVDVATVEVSVLWFRGAGGRV